MFSEILKAAAFDIAFFAIMFIIVLVGYSLSTFILFGVRNKDFSTFSDALLTCVLVVIGAYRYEEVNVLEKTSLRLLGISFLFVNLLLLNMFIAIIGSHYFEYYSENSGSDQNNLPKLIVRMMFDKEIKNLLETNSEKMLENKTFCQKFTIQIKIWLIEYILGEEEEFQERHNYVEEAKVQQTTLHNVYRLGDQVIDQHILDLVNQPTDEYSHNKMVESRIKNMIKLKQIDRMSFWVALLETAVDSSISKNYLHTLRQEHSLLSNLHTHKVDELLNQNDQDQSLEDHQVNFVIMTLDEKLHAWKQTNDTDK